MAKAHKRDYKREQRIMQLYKAGNTYRKIGEMLDISRVRVGQIYRRMLAEKGTL